MHAYLTMLAGDHAGHSILLDPAAENRIGRDRECTVVLSDLLCSRVHAVIVYHDDRWWVRDGESLNGTYVNDQKIDEAALGEGHVLRVGTTEMTFHERSSVPRLQPDTVVDVTQTLVKDAQVASGKPDAFNLAALGASEQAQDLLLLYQLSIKLLGSSDPGEVIRSSLELLHERIGASLVGFLWRSDDGHLRPYLLVPAAAEDCVSLSETLTRLVVDEGRAVWIANQRFGEDDESLQHYADALCVPLWHDGRVIGAIHVYLEQGRFRQSQFDFAISLANITAVALARARHDLQLARENEQLRAQSPGYDELVGDSPGMRELKAKIQRLAAAAGAVLVRGESGVGKELVARAIHRASPRADRPLLSVNCAAIPENLIESQLFGHKAGAFTGADRDHVGYFQQADLGTLFLDEVGELTLAGQAKLLRILEGHPFMPVGSTTEVRVDVRVIAATNQDLARYVRDRKFREDLYYRLSVFELLVPPLRERGDDVARLIDFFLDHYRRQHGRPYLMLTDEARQKLLAYQWPGNVRQLRNAIDSAVVLAGGDSIGVGDLGLRDSGTGQLESLRFDYWEAKLIEEALRRTEQNVPEAARMLGIGRATLYRKLDEYGLRR